jgi:hypothetical protein
MPMNMFMDTYPWFFDAVDVAVDSQGVVVLKVGRRLKLGAVQEVCGKNMLWSLYRNFLGSSVLCTGAGAHGRRRPRGLVDQAEVAGGPYLGALANESHVDRDAVLDGSSIVHAVDGV